jgi:predicted ATPase
LLVARGQAAFADGALERADALFTEALALWHGDALEDVRYAQFAQTEIRRLEELRLSALEARIDAELALGRHAALVPELEAHAGTHPWRERFHGQLMLALYRCGRQQEALEAYQTARRALDEELGLEPGAELRELESKILQQDASLQPAGTAAPSSLPIPATRLIGRERELAALDELLGDEGAVRLLTLVGPGGVGKTRLAVELAAASDAEVVFVDLSPLSAVEQVMPAVAHALGVRETGDQTLAEATAVRVRGFDDCLLVVDNCERVVEAAPELAVLLASCPKLQLLATSREPLHITAEHEFLVEPLSEEGALSLFVERGRRVQPSFAADDAAAAVCRRLDCLPLALELAAARTNVLTAQQILERLERRDDLLTAGARDAPARQRTLQAVIDWSYELLDPDEKQLLAFLAVFAGGSSLEAAEEVCGARLDTLAALVDKNLLRSRAGRFQMLDTIREYATDLLEESNQAQELRRRHLEYFLALVEHDDNLETPPRVLAVVADDQDNLRAALAWAVEAAPELALQLAAMLWSSWWERGVLAEGRRWLEQALLGAPDTPSPARASALLGAGWLAFLTGDQENSSKLVEAALSDARTIGDPRTEVIALDVSSIRYLTGDKDSEAGRRLIEEAIAIARLHEYRAGLALSLAQLATIARRLGQFDEAIALNTEALALDGDSTQAAGARNIRLLNLGVVELQAGKSPAIAAERFESVFLFASKHGHALYVAQALWSLGFAAASAAHNSVAVQVLAAAANQHAALGMMALDLRELNDQTVETLRDSLGAEAFAAAWSEGLLLSPEDAAARALGAIRSGDPEADTPTPRHATRKP